MLQQGAINALRILSVDMINKANSGHPGICLGAAPILEVVYSEFMNVYYEEDKWINRDRFVLSAGHGAPLLYSLLHLAKIDLSIEDLKNLRQLNSRTHGHPEMGNTKGIDASTGPLGQGVSMAVGMAIAEKFLARKFNKEELKLIDHYTYTLIGDGDLQEGITQEALSLAGHLGLNKLIVLFDSNDIQLDGSTHLTISENFKKKYEAMNFNYILVQDGNEHLAIKKAIKKAKKCSDKPTLIEIKTTIGYKSALEGKSEIHGSPLGVEKTKELRKNLGWDYEPFDIPKSVYYYFKNKISNRGKKAYYNWKKIESSYKTRYPKEYEEFTKALRDSYESDLKIEYKIGYSNATRNTSGEILELLSKEFTTLIGGSADLTKSTKAKGSGGNFDKENNGRNINFGVREHAMGAITNGINLHQGIRAFCGGFFVFSDYLKPAIRLASLMDTPSIFIFSHDSIAVGEDGPTHQPIEQLIGLRSIPNLNVLRPADANETLASLKIALKSKSTPSVIVLTRQNVTVTNTNTDLVKKGAYIIKKEKNQLDGIILATGSEVELAYKASFELEKHGYGVRVVSMPSCYLFDNQAQEYQESILPKSSKVLSVEMGSTLGWYKYADEVLGIDTFGKSGPFEQVLSDFNFDVKTVMTKFIKLVENKG